MIQSSDVLLIFLGALLTYISTSIIEWGKNRGERKEKSHNFKLVIKQELKTIEKTLEKLKTVFEYKFYYDYTILDKLRKNIDSFEAFKSDAIFLNNAELQEKFIDLISDISDYVASIRSLQDVYYNQQQKITEDIDNRAKKKLTAQTSIYKDHKENMDEFNRRSVEKAIDFVEIKRRLDEFLKQVDLK